jgi:hypothetical protein
MPLRKGHKHHNSLETQPIPYTALLWSNIDWFSIRQEGGGGQYVGSIVRGLCSKHSFPLLMHRFILTTQDLGKYVPHRIPACEDVPGAPYYIFIKPRLMRMSPNLPPYIPHKTPTFEDPLASLPTYLTKPRLVRVSLSLPFYISHKPPICKDVP